MPDLRIKRASSELVSAFDEAKGGMGRYLKRRQTSRDALSVLLFVYDQVRREGRLRDVLERYTPVESGLVYR